MVSPTSTNRLESSNSRISEGANGSITLSALLNGFNGSPVILSTCSRNSPRLLTPSKYRLHSGRECATQTDCESEIDLQVSFFYWDGFHGVENEYIIILMK